MDKIKHGIYLSGIDKAINCDKEKFDKIITVCQDSIKNDVDNNCSYEFFNMNDGKSCNYELFKNACDSLLTAISSGQKTLIHCHMGQSRSFSVCIAVLAVYDNISYSKALNIVKSNRKIPDFLSPPNSHFKKYIKKYIKNNN